VPQSGVQGDPSNAKVFCKRKNAHAGSISLLWMFTCFLHEHFDEGLQVFGPTRAAFRRTFSGVHPSRTCEWAWHVITMGGVLVGCPTCGRVEATRLPFKTIPPRACGNPGPECFCLQQLDRATELNNGDAISTVIIQPWRFERFHSHKHRAWKRVRVLRTGLSSAQINSRRLAAQMAGDFTVQLIKQRAGSRVQLIQAEER